MRKEVKEERKGKRECRVARQTRREQRSENHNASLCLRMSFTRPWGRGGEEGGRGEGEKGVEGKEKPGSVSVSREE